MKWSSKLPPSKGSGHRKFEKNIKIGSRVLETRVYCSEVGKCVK